MYRVSITLSYRNSQLEKAEKAFPTSQVFITRNEANE